MMRNRYVFIPDVIPIVFQKEFVVVVTEVVKVVLIVSSNKTRSMIL